MAKTRRELILEEMGLTPIWRLRGAAAAEQDDAAVDAGTGVLDQTFAASGDRPRATGHAPPATGQRSRVSGRAFPLEAADSRAAEIMGLDWSGLKARVATCTDCVLHQKRTKTVFGVGDENADWLFVGEGPGADEDAQGKPFVGQAGKLLDNMLAAIQLRRGQNVYIANCVKCRPPGNRNPEPGELHACEPYLQRQIELIGPKLIVALGKVAVSGLLATDASIASLRGKIHQYRGIPLIVTYHPAYLLRNLPDKAKAWVDLCFAVRVMNDLQRDNAIAHDA